MNDELDHADIDRQLTIPPRNDRILVILVILSVAGTIMASLLVSARFGIGILIGCILAFVNYFWMKHSLAKIFTGAREGEKASFVGAGYFIRYIVLGLVVAFFYFFNILPITALLIGMAGIGFAVLVEASIRAFSGNKF